jgi:hypothetical protein
MARKYVMLRKDFLIERSPVDCAWGFNPTSIGNELLQGLQRILNVCDWDDSFIGCHTEGKLYSLQLEDKEIEF